MDRKLIAGVPPPGPDAFGVNVAVNQSEPPLGTIFETAESRVCPSNTGVPIEVAVAQVFCPSSWHSHPFASMPSTLYQPGLQVAIAQTSPAHVAVAFARAHALLQAPQCVSESSEFSQPFESRPSQLPHPGLQVAIAQTSPAQVGVALAGAHAALQAPQCVSESRVFSQPFESIPSQLPQPALQVEIAHTSPAQVAVAFAREHAELHAPQCASESSEFSQPFRLIPSQLPHPGLQVEMLHTSPAQVAVAFARVQAVLQAPQFARLSSESSQPFTLFASQLPQPGLQVAMLHTSPEQVAVAFARVQAVLQAPQFARLSSEFSQPFESIESQLPQPELQEEIAHTSPEQVPVAFARVQAVLHAPQFARLSSEFSQPFESIASQLPQPELQVEIAHTSPAQVGVAFARVQAVAHAPQLVSESSEFSQPFALIPSQLPHPALQVMPHVLREQVGVPLVALQARPQPPQCSGLVVVFTSQPLLARPSQLPKPAAQEMVQAPSEQPGVPFAELHAWLQPPQ